MVLDDLHSGASAAGDSICGVLAGTSDRSQCGLFASGSTLVL